MENTSRKFSFSITHAVVEENKIGNTKDGNIYISLFRTSAFLKK